jgi:proteasome lid subunit RPN8/RPN11
VIQLAAAPLAAIRRHAAEAFPEECCGIMGGTTANGVKRVEAVLPLPNGRTDSPGNRYFAPAEAIRQAEAGLRARGLEVIGFYHSHPNAPAKPSAYDLEQATWPWLSYLIVSVEEGQAKGATSWTLADDRSGFVQEDIDVSPPGREGKEGRD